MNYRLLLVLIFIAANAVYSQNVGVGTASPHPSAALEIKDSIRGFLPPRLTTAQRNSIQNPASGLQIYNITTECLEVFGRGKWNPIYCVPLDSTMLSDIDGNTYPTVKICDQTWMAKNLNVARYRNGDPIPQVTDPSQWSGMTTGAWCWYNNDSATYGSVYGRLYNWYAVNDPRGLAPEGWHVPTDAEWNTAVMCLDSNSDTTCIDCIPTTTSGISLKETGTVHWISPNLYATNLSGFSGLPGGNRNSDGDFLYVDSNKIGSYGFWWSSTSTSVDRAFNRELHYNNASVPRYNNFKTYGYSVRCIRDVNSPTSSLDSGLVAYYPFNGNANDESGNGNHGMVNGATLTTDRLGVPSKAYSFNGLNNYINLDHISQLGGLQQLTLSVWFKTGSGGVIFGHWINNSAPPGPIGLIAAINGNNSVYSALNGGEDLNTINTFENVGWKLLTIIFDGSKATNSERLKVYINTMPLQYNFGIRTVPTNIGSQANTTYLGVVGQPNVSNNLCCYFNGSLDEIRIYNRVLTQAEISYLSTH